VQWEECSGEENHDWVFLPGKYESDLGDACLAAKAEEDLGVDGDCYFPQVDFPGVAKKSCLYNMVVDALGIYNVLLGGWPLPTPYPADPFNVTGP